MHYFTSYFIVMRRSLFLLIEIMNTSLAFSPPFLFDGVRLASLEWFFESMTLIASVMKPRESAANNCHPYDKGSEEDGHHWESLTDDLHVMVLNKLPFFSLMRFRTVCKKWNSLILSREITPLGMKFTPKTVPIFFSHGPLILFDSRKNTWQEQSLDFIKYPHHTLSLLVSAGGLLCFKTSYTGELIVCNPISMRCRYLTLPRGFDSQALTDPLPDLSKPVVTLDGGKEAIEAFQRSCGKEVVVGLLTETHKQWYKLVIAGISDGSRRTTLVYDSFMHQWKEGGAVPQGIRFWESGKNVNLNGCLYCITFTAGMPSGESNLEWPWSVVRYDSSNDAWTEIRLRTRGSILPQLAEHRGRILVIQRNGKAENEISFSEIKEDGRMLFLMTRHMPSTLFPLITRKRCPMILQDWCVGQGDWLYIAGRRRGHENEGSHSPRGLTVVAHSFSRNTWILLPTLMDEPKLCAHFSATLNGYYSATWLHAFEPSLCAAVW